MSKNKLCCRWRRLLLCLPLLFLLHHLVSVLRLQKHNRKFPGDVPCVEGANELKKKMKFDHLVLGPAAGQGLRDRLHCQGNKALNRTHSPTSGNSLFGDNVSLVTVFATYDAPVDSQSNDRLANMVTVGNVSYSKMERSIAILNVFINFIQATMPRSSIIILTDPSTQLPVKRNKVFSHPIQGEYSRDKLMLQRIRSYIIFLQTRYKEKSRLQGKVNHYIFTDSDLAVVSNLGQIFEDYPNFDIALTFRNNKDQPLNSGFIAVRGTPDGILRAKHFLQQVLEIYSTRYLKASRMLGDQLALAWVVFKSNHSFDARRFTRGQPFLDKINGASVLFLPCALYNWTPPEGAGQFHGMPLDVKVIHFKGSRKRLMLESWNFYNSSSLPSPQKLSDMLCLILRSGRTKYDF
ncbi:unnamed protein product [Cuscuta campestris]|uniref:Nucleotide-diphospho-sugar transferase domain-containing protein n=1 Tax=Cuscuta campestris TaxID=132261 RepID=A0A484M7C3_9ASTE|nr:unnamed protein product [Cuscuta campestris]